MEADRSFIQSFVGFSVKLASSATRKVPSTSSHNPHKWRKTNLRASPVQTAVLKTADHRASSTSQSPSCPGHLVGSYGHCHPRWSLCPRPSLGEDLHSRGEGAGRKLETAMCRLWVGHTWLTQSYLLKNEDQPFCYACDSLYTVRHILIECLDFQDTRKKYFSVTDLYRLFREVNPSRIVGYLKDLGVYGNI
ncbi:ribonuclease hi [Plakobranchus ocellatus]|uniref:Ribonuclease hi n=1 Tax=Plakobranchus ocellatus TaxID=259542 RepID=A0AAV4DZ96_9GAST|nr:ribonuclease hi [Plakobranchus ocellatus]